MTASALRTAVILLTALVLQASLLTQVRFFDVSADLMLVLAVAAGLVGGPDRGALVGFFAGLLMDLLVQTPFALSALTYALVGYLAGAAAVLSVASTRWFPFVLGFLGGVAGVMIFVLLGEVVGEPLLETPDLLTIAAVVGLTTALLTPPVSRLLSWAWRPRVVARSVT